MRSLAESLTNMAKKKEEKMKSAIFSICNDILPSLCRDYYTMSAPCGFMSDT